MRSQLNVGDQVIYAAPKWGPRPSSSAQKLRPSAGGEDYSYVVAKFWVVDRVEEDHIVIRTRKGKRRQVPITDPKLRRASWFERLLHRRRFPAIGELAHSEVARGHGEAT